MSMSKKDFIALADALRETKPDLSENSQETYLHWCRMRDAIADVCLAANSRFNYVRWTDYIHGLCGPNGGTR